MRLSRDLSPGERSQGKKMVAIFTLFCIVFIDSENKHKILNKLIRNYKRKEKKRKGHSHNYNTLRTPKILEEFPCLAEELLAFGCCWKENQFCSMEYIKRSVYKLHSRLSPMSRHSQTTQTEIERRD